MNDPTLIADLVRAGVDAELVGRVSNALLVASVRGRSVDDMDAKLVKDRERKRIERENLRRIKGLAKANDVAASAPVSAPVHGPSADTSDERCNLLTSLSSNCVEKEEKKERASVVTRARGTRMVPDQTITETDWTFAIDASLTPAAARNAWAEFVDYWIAVPGQRGLKTNWSATWRNRVRELVKRGNVNGRQNDPKSLLGALDRQIDKFGGMDAARAYVPGSSGPTPPSLDFGDVPKDRKLISSR